MLGVYKSNLTLMTFQRKMNVHIGPPRPFNVEIASTKQHFLDFKFHIKLRIGCQRRYLPWHKMEAGNSVPSKK